MISCISRRVAMATPKLYITPQYMFSSSSLLRTEIENSIQSNKVLVFSKTYCPYCDAAKDTLSNITPPAEVVELDTLDDGAERQAILATISGQRTVPNIFIDGKHLGGNSDLQTASKNGNLKELLDGANVKHDF